MRQWAPAREHPRVRQYGNHPDCRCAGLGIAGAGELLRSCLRPHRAISQEKLPLHLDFFGFVRSARRRGTTLLGGSLQSS
jgi:hypothetical protein